MLAVTLPRRLDRGAMLVPSHADDGAVDATWSWHDVATDNHSKVTLG
jgi:hypothetical protein